MGAETIPLSAKQLMLVRRTGFYGGGYRSYFDVLKHCVTASPMHILASKVSAAHSSSFVVGGFCSDVYSPSLAKKSEV